jgi:uncharacterized protein
MANQFDPRAAYTATTGRGVEAGSFDAGLRSYMLSVYNTMASGVLLTGLIALFFAQSGLVQSLFDPMTGKMSGLGWLATLSPLAMVFVLSFGINRLSETAAKAIFWAYAALMGVSLSTIFLVYTGSSIATTFFATAAGFAGLSLYGYTTKRDLSGFGKFLMMGVLGIIVVMVANVFIKSSALGLSVSILGVFLFAVLTVYDTQKIKNIYDQVAGSDFEGKAVIMGALTLYLDFINMFLFLLRFMGNSRN